MNRSRLLGLFLEETRDHLAEAARAIEAFGRRPQAPEVLRTLMRHFHSLKGMAATMGFEAFVELSHRMEGLLRELEERPRAWSDELAPLFSEGLDHLAAWTERIADGEVPRHDVASSTLVARVDSLLNEKLGSETGRRETPAGEGPGAWAVRLSLQVSSASPTHRILTTLRRVGTIGRVIRVRPPQLPLDAAPSAMVLEFELATPRTPQALRRSLSRLAWVAQVELQPIAPRPCAPSAGARPSEWTRVPTESLDWIADTLRELAFHHGRRRENDAGAPPDPGSYLIKRAYERVSELRLVPLMSLGHRLEPAVRDAARREGKQVRFALSGGDAGLERPLLDRLVEPLRHLARNAVVHGIESPAEREAAGKPAEGLVRLTVARRAERLRLELTDDGRGMDAAALRRAAIAAGELDVARAENLSHAESLRLAFLPAVTTRASADRLAGRGAGLDVVAEAFAELEAGVEVHSEPGEGTRFEFDVPLRRAVVRSLVFCRAGRVFAVPLRSVLRATSIPSAAAGVRIVDLEPDAPPPDEQGFCLELDRTARPLAVLADEVLGSRDLWVQPPATPLARATWVGGAAIIDEGALALLIDPERLPEEQPATA